MGLVELPGDDLVGQAHQLVLEPLVVAGLPDVLEDAVDVDLPDPQAPEMEDALLDMGDVVARDGHLGRGLGELLEPAREVPDDVVVGSPPVRIDALEIVLGPRAVERDLDAQVGGVLGDEPLDAVVPVEEAVGREAEPVALEPGMAQLVGAELEVVADPVDEPDLEEGLAADEVPHDGSLGHELPLGRGDSRWPSGRRRTRAGRPCSCRPCSSSGSGAGSPR